MTSPLTTNSEPIARQQAPPRSSFDPVFTVLDPEFRAVFDELQRQADPEIQPQDWNDESRSLLCEWLREDDSLMRVQKAKLYLWQSLGEFPARMSMPDWIARTTVKAIPDNTVKVVLQGSYAAVTALTHQLHYKGLIAHGTLCKPQFGPEPNAVTSLGYKRLAQAASSNEEDKASVATYKAVVTMLALDSAFSLDGDVFFDVDCMDYATEITHIESLAPRQRLQLAHRLLSQLLAVASA